MTAIKPSSDLDRFGLGPDLGAPNPKSSLQGEHWVPIRDLHARHRPRILDHLLHLDERDRYLRFGFPATQHQMAQYVASIDFKRSYLEARTEDVVIIDSPVGMPGRAIRNQFIDDVYHHQHILNDGVVPRWQGSRMPLSSMLAEAVQATLAGPR